MANKLDKFQCDLNIEFVDKKLLRQALTHRSVGKVNNERLEFLGDAVLGMIISEQLYLRLPDVDEGTLSRYRSTLVCKETLAEIAKTYDFSEVLVMGPGEMRSGSASHSSIIADAFEALLGAIYLDRGEQYARKFLLGVYTEKFENLPNVEELKDPKTRLQEWLQERKIPLPKYSTLEEKNTHPQEFEVLGEVSQLDVSVSAKAASRRKAEQKVAKMILQQITND